MVILLVSARCSYHANGMMRGLFYIFSLAAAGLAAYAIWQDLNSPFSASAALGQLWYGLHPSSLQISEAVISRYIDPCGLIVALNCTPFLWHPLLSTFLGWPAGLIGVVLAGIFWFLARQSSTARRARCTANQNL